MNGIDITCDCYPYFAFSTRIGATTYVMRCMAVIIVDYDACQLDGRQILRPAVRPGDLCRDAEIFRVFNRLLRDGSEGYPHGISLIRVDAGEAMD